VPELVRRALLVANLLFYEPKLQEEGVVQFPVAAPPGVEEHQGVSVAVVGPPNLNT